ncbi:hypothetical protein DL98DRAFT_143460 [Cadophora sp. DSE1049]|nr:hypothetical protein DL98DRAFT_143460 [Cadophora sp. DSE1049]
MPSLSANFTSSTSMDDSSDYTSQTGSELSVHSKQPGPGGPYKSQVSIEVRSFEFINSEDKDGTRRAKSHAVKDFKRRQKAEGVRFQRLRESGKKKAIAANPPPRRIEESSSYPRDRSSPPVLVPSPALAFASASSVDPFSHFPVQLNSTKDLGLIHHYHSTFIPKPFEIAQCDYGPFRKLIFDVVVHDPAAFLLVVSGAAEDIAVRSKKPVSQQAIIYRAKAMNIINSRMQSPEDFKSDGSISACVLLAGLELLHGSIESYETHMDGLCLILKMRGGFQVVQKSNPLLAALMAWFDYTGSAGLVGKRRFEFTSCDPTTFSQSIRPPRFTPPLNVTFKTIPKNYTLYEDLMIILDGLENATLLTQEGLPDDPEQLQKYTIFLQHINDDLLRTLALPSKTTNVFRRFLIEDSFRLAALIYLSGITNCLVGGVLNCELFLSHLHLKILDPSTDWGHSIGMILRLLMGGGRVHSQENVYYVMQLMDMSVTMNWSAWKFVRDTLLDYLLHAEVCTGLHQSLWLCRMDIVEE